MAHLLLPAALGLPGFIGGIISAVEAGKRLSGGRLARYRPRHKFGGRVKRMRPRKGKRKGRGMAADIVSSIPLLGSIAGPLVRALGGRLRRKRYYRKKGRGLVPMKIYQPIAYGAGLLGPGAYRPAIYGGPLGVYEHTKPGFPYKLSKGGLLSPTGFGGAAFRKGHYRRVAPGKRVYVKPAMVKSGGANRRSYRFLR